MKYEYVGKPQTISGIGEIGPGDRICVDKNVGENSKQVRILIGYNSKGERVFSDPFILNKRNVRPL